MGFPGGSDGKESSCVEGAWVWSLGWEDSLEKGMATHSRILAEESHGQRILVGFQSMVSQNVRHTEQLTVSLFIITRINILQHSHRWKLSILS